MDGDGRVHIRLADQPWTVLNNAAVVADAPAFEGSWLRGIFVGDRRTVRTSFREFTLHLWSTFIVSRQVS